MVCIDYFQKELEYIREFPRDLAKIFHTRLSKEQYDIICYEAIRRCPEMIEYVSDPNMLLCAAAIQADESTIRFLSYDKCLQFLEFAPKLLRFIPDYLQTEEMCLIAVKKNPMCLKYVHNQTEPIVFSAITYAPIAIIYVRDPTNTTFF